MNPTVFLSHSSKDKPIVERIYTDLKRENIGVWFDKWEIVVGDSIIEKIEQGLKHKDYLVIVLSTNSVESEWVKKELSAALMEEIEEKSVVVLPIVIEDCEKPLLLKDKRHADFRENYQKGLNELIIAIKAHQERREIQEEFEKLEPEEQIRLIRNMRKDLSSLIRENKINELERIPLPMVSLIKEVGEEEARTYHNYFEDSRKYEDLPLDLQSIEVRKVDLQEYERAYMLHPGWKLLNRQVINEHKKGTFNQVDGGSITVIKYEGYAIVGIFTKLLELYSELFEERLLAFKNDFNLNTYEWDEIKDTIKEMMKNDMLPQEIHNFIIEYIFLKTEKGKKRLAEIFKEGAYNPLSQKEIDYYHKLSREIKRD